ncbi:unnamed protein product [Polarella glacialis]|uniref:HEAT repeat domain-containing protein n=1 Tax=Polarella glacialis TaxID=89957 RepID=A0A813G678_POLGL|nr:unnamed protein product [Polarella glacialis]
MEGPSAAKYASEIGKLLDDEEPDVRRAAAVALGKVGPAAASQAAGLAAALKDEDASVRAAAAEALGVLGREASSRYAEKLAALAGDGDEEVALAAVASLSALCEASRLAPFVDSGLPSVSRAALCEIGRCPAARSKHADLIARGLLHKDATVRLAAVQASGELGPACSQEHLAQLAAMRTGEKQVRVRKAAVQALGRSSESGTLHLLSFFRDSDEGIRHFAADTLASTGGEAAVSGAAGLLEDPEPVVRQTALLALGRAKQGFGLAFAGAVAAQLRDEDFASKLAAIQALSDLGAESEAGALGALVHDPSKGARQAVVSALAKMGPRGASEALPFLADKDPGVRQAAVKVFSPLHSKLPAEVARLHVGALAYCLVDEDWRVRLATVVALGDLHAAETAEQVAALCRDNDDQVRRSAVSALEKMGASPALVAGFLGDDDKGVRAAAERAFQALGGGRSAGDEDGELSEAD